MTERPIRTKPTRGQSEVYERKKKLDDRLNKLTVSSPFCREREVVK